MDDDNMFHCDDCSRKKPVYTVAEKRILMLEPPMNLIINLKRFKHGRRGSKKVNKKVSFGIYLSMDKYMMHQSKSPNTQPYLTQIYMRM